MTYLWKLLDLKDEERNSPDFEAKRQIIFLKKERKKQQNQVSIRLVKNKVTFLRYSGKENVDQGFYIQLSVDQISKLQENSLKQERTQGIMYS